MITNQCVKALVEGSVDYAVVEKLFSKTGIKNKQIQIQRGINKLLQRLPGFNEYAKFGLCFALCDLDDKESCAPNLYYKIINTFRNEKSTGMYISIAVRAVEAWLMADYKEFARHLHIREGRIPKKPEEEENPKRTIVNLARNSRSSMIKREVVPSQKNGRSKGNGYEDIMIEFVQKNGALYTLAREPPAWLMPLNVARLCL